MYIYRLCLFCTEHPLSNRLNKMLENNTQILQRMITMIIIIPFCFQD